MMDETTSLLRKDPVRPKPANRFSNFHYAIGLVAFTGALFYLVSTNLPVDGVASEEKSSPAGSDRSVNNALDVDIDTLNLHMTVTIDDESGLAILTDRSPVFCRHSSLSSWFTCPDGAYVELASADYKKNLNGNGWNYLSIEANDMWEMLIESPSPASVTSTTTTKSEAAKGSAHHQNDDDDHVSSRRPAPTRMEDLIEKLKASGDLSLVRQQYVRSMHAIGLLEGYLSCKEIGDWYANFYDGLFEGGEVNIPTMEFLEQNHVWMNTQASLYWEVDEYWMVVKGILAQLEGLLIGAQNGCPGTPLDNTDDAHSISDYKGVYMPSFEHGVSMQHLLLMNANGDMFQIMQKYPANLVNATTNSMHRHGDNTIDTEPQVDDYVDDYFIAKTHNRTHERDDDDEAYAYGDTDQMESSRQLMNSGAMRTAVSQGQVRPPSAYYMPSKRLNPADIPKGDPAAVPRPLPSTLTKEQIMALPNIGTEHCSAIIKVLPDLSDVVFGHDTWDEYQTAYPRVFKHLRYNRMKDSLPIRNDMIDAYFSASPGLMASIDDYYVIHGVVANLAVTETSLDIYNDALVELINPSTMLCWARAIAANRLATSGNTWAEAFSRYHSGTYANQWMVLDFNRFESFQQPRPGFLTVLEELPGLMHHEDLTDTLVNKGYWASYNNPYFKEIAVMSGVAAKCEIDATYCHPSTPRAKIFRAKQDSVRTVADLQRLMQYNQYATDPNSRSDSCKAIACRKDLEPTVARRSPFGAIDAKVSSVNLASRRLYTSTNLRSSDKHAMPTTASTTLGRVTRQSPSYGVIQPVILVKLGPTIDNVPPFCWSVVGPTEGDVTTASPHGMALPAAIAKKNISAPDPGESTYTRRLRAAGEDSSEEKGASEDSVEDDQSGVDDGQGDGYGAGTADGANDGDVETPTTTSTITTTTTAVEGPVPTARPTFLEGPRKYVHMGHPECFAFGWETMPPQEGAYRNEY